MIKALLLVLMGAIAGGFSGNVIAHRLAAPHQHPRAVMTLLGFHHDRLDAANKAGDCAGFETERAHLEHLQQEIALALPLTYKDEAGFRKSADALGSAAQPVAASAPPAADAVVAAAATPALCPQAAAQFKQITDACDECHKVYDPR